MTNRIKQIKDRARQNAKRGIFDNNVALTGTERFIYSTEWGKTTDQIIKHPDLDLEGTNQ